MATSKYIDDQINKNYNKIGDINTIFPKLLDLINKEYGLLVTNVMQYKFHACNTVLFLENKIKDRFILKIFNKNQREGQFELEEIVHNKLLETNIEIPSIIRTKQYKLNCIFNGKKVVLYNFIIAREVGSLKKDISFITKNFAYFHKELNNDSRVKDLCNKYNLYNRDFGNIDNYIFKKLLVYFSNSDYKVILKIINDFKNFKVDLDSSIIYGGLNKNHIAVSDKNLIIYDSEGIGLGNRYLDAIYFAYYIGYRNNNEKFDIKLINHVLETYKTIYNINISNNLYIYILYFFIYDLRIMLKQKDEFIDFQIKRHYLNTLKFYGDYIKQT